MVFMHKKKVFQFGKENDAGGEREFAFQEIEKSKSTIYRYA